eukprot:827441-Amorphochlora_amoeboformis.AAC.2
MRVGGASREGWRESPSWGHGGVWIWRQKISTAFSYIKYFPPKLVGSKRIDSESTMRRSKRVQNKVCWEKLEEYLRAGFVDGVKSWVKERRYLNFLHNLRGTQYDLKH